MVAHSSIPAGKIPRTEEPGGLHCRGRKESDTTEAAGHEHAQTRTREEAWRRHPSRRDHAVLEP